MPVRSTARAHAVSLALVASGTLTNACVRLTPQRRELACREPRASTPLAHTTASARTAIEETPIEITAKVHALYKL